MMQSESRASRARVRGRLLRRLSNLLVIVVIQGFGAATSPARVAAQVDDEVTYRNTDDGTVLSAILTLPDRPDPGPGVVLLSVAGTSAMVERLVDQGYAVLAPVRRGFVAVEPLLASSYADLASDVHTALRFLADRPEVDGASLAIMAQADDGPPALLAMVGARAPVPLVLMAPPAASGVIEFRREQRWLARRQGARPDELRALDAYIDGIVEIARSTAPPYVREYRLAELRLGASVQLPRNAAFPDDERQAHFFASPLWKDRLEFEPEVVLGLLRSPVLVMIGTDDANTPLEPYVDAVRRGFAAARSDDAALCLLHGRTRHTFTAQAIDVIVEWLEARVGTDASATPDAPGPVSACLDPDRD